MTTYRQTAFGVPVDVGTVNQEGVSPLAARADHVHAGTSTATPTFVPSGTVFVIEADTQMLFASRCIVDGMIRADGIPVIL